MAKGFMYGNGGSNIINLKVVGGTSAPASPKENTIWVNTDAAITDWIFNTSTPTTRCDGSALSGGEVWFKCGTSATAPINILKKNAAWEYPNVCYQYISGAWVIKTAKTYQSGTWVDWITWLYNNGNEFTALTGGWGARRCAGGSFGKTSSTIYLQSTTTNGDINASCSTNNAVSCTEYSTLVFNISSISGTAGLRFGLTDNPDMSSWSFVAVTQGNYTTAKSYVVDISSVTGSHYVYAALSGVVGSAFFSYICMQ